VWAGFAVRACALFAVCAFIAVQGLAQSSEGVQKGEKETPALCQDVFDMWRTAAVIAAFYERVLLHVSQALDQRAAADGM
jgi:hypothetical protein